ncbi:MAG: excinuclease ABC subunit UvrA [Bacillota bacterium]|nr:excinuclease ABC subunit UvrA [Bacillota bacterium]
MHRQSILVKGAREHNLKNIDVEIPRNQLVVITGLSGSGKSSLAFDTIFAEGQRRYVESLSTYARQFLGRMDKPDVDYIEGLSPAISIDQKAAGRNPRSTVGTVTEIYDYMRLLFARIGRPHCPQCGRPIAQQTVQQMVDCLMGLPPETQLVVLAPLVRGRKGEHEKILEELARDGFVRARIDGTVYELAEAPKLDKNRKHTVEAVVDRLVMRPGLEKRLADSLETSVKLSGGLVVIDLGDGRELVFSQNYACPECGISIEELTPRMFSFNSPYGACPSCSGLGTNLEIDPDLIMPDLSKSLADGAVAPWSRSSTTYWPQLLEAVAAHFGFSTEVPVGELTEEQRHILLFGAPKARVRFRYENPWGRVRVHETVFEGVVHNLTRRYKETTSEGARLEIEEFMSSRPCPACKGARLRPEALAVTVADRSISEVTALSVQEALQFFSGLELSERDETIARQVIKEILERLGFMANVGLDYLTLDRPAGTLAGGEAQRIRLATQVGSSLMGVLYILDEPSIGLHQRDNQRLLATLKRLRDLGNTVIVVEHDEETILSADHIIDIGPGAGEHGGRLVASGTVAEVIGCPESITGQYLCGARRIPMRAARRPLGEKALTVRGAAEHNLKDVDVSIPLNMFVCVTGVSGSGKSTLVNDIIYRRLAAELNGARSRPGQHRALEGLEHLDRVINVDQAPIGRTPRSNPATYTGLFGYIRELMARTPEARVRGYRPGRFSFNVRGGRCEACRGDGIIKIEMHFLPDVYVPCEVCHGKRYNRETLEVRFKGKNIAEILDMTVEEAFEFLRNVPSCRRKLETLHDVGLGYIRLGQPATTLSGGEAQRVKLAAELSRRSNGRTLYILDEPTTGLHLADIERLLDVLQRLVDAGDTVLVIEHNLEVIKTADWVIDLGPEGGDRGGLVVGEGTPEGVAAESGSHTAAFLRPVLARSGPALASAETASRASAGAGDAGA